MLPDNRHGLPSAEVLLRVSLWSVLLGVVSYTRADPDLWGHVRFGLDILRDVSIPVSDPYSFTTDREWVNHEWAAEVITAGAFHVAGNTGLILVKLSVIAAVLLLLDRTLREEGIQVPLLRDCMAGVAVITTMGQMHHVRPQLFSILCFAVLLWCLIQGTRSHGRLWLILLPVLFAAWANLHGGWIVGGGVLALWTAGLVLRGAVHPAAWCASVGVLSVLATLVTPYGWEIWRFLVDTVGFGRADITEWQPVYVLAPRATVLWCTAAALAVLGIAHGWSKPWATERWAVVAALGIGAFFVSRLLAFFALATLFLLGAAITERFRRRRASTPAEQPARARVGVAVVAVSVTFAALGSVAINVARVEIDPRMTPEADAVSVLRQRSNGERVLVWFDWGQYAIWHLSPRMRVSIDGRRETVYSESLQDRHLRFYFGAPDGASLPREIAADYIWIPRALPIVRRLRMADGWARLYEGEQSVIFARADLADIQAPRTGLVAATSRTFPGP